MAASEAGKSSEDGGNDHIGSPRGPRAFGSGVLEYGVAGEVSLRWAAADLTSVVEEARRRHDLSPIVAVALGRAMAGAALLHRLSIKATRRLTLTVAGDGPIGRIVAEVNQEGDLRGFVGEPRVDLPRSEDGKLRIADAVGTGTLRVNRELLDGSTYESQVALATGEIGLDLAHFLEQSEQTQSAVMVGVLEGPEGVRSAGGMIVEVLPGAGAAAVDRLERNLSADSSVSRTLDRDGLVGLRERVLSGLDCELIERRELRFRCGCDRDRLRDQLAALSGEERASIADDDGVVVAECAFCGERYLYASTELPIA
jgi:molecular chaperone Hsp33